MKAMHDVRDCVNESFLGDPVQSQFSNNVKKNIVLRRTMARSLTLWFHKQILQSELHTFPYTIEPRYNEGLRDCRQNLFAVSKSLSMYFTISGVKKIVRYIEDPLEDKLREFVKRSKRFLLLILITFCLLWYRWEKINVCKGYCNNECSFTIKVKFRQAVLIDIRWKLSPWRLVSGQLYLRLAAASQNPCWTPIQNSVILHSSKQINPIGGYRPFQGLQLRF